MGFAGFDWRRKAYEFEKERLAIDLLLGHQELRHMLEGSKSIQEIFALYDRSERVFGDIRQKYLHY